jgi:hypothetical protein
MLRSTAAQTAIAAALNAALSTTAQQRPRATVYRDGSEGVGISASVAQCKQAIQQALAALQATAISWGTLLTTTTGDEDSEVTFTYKAQQCYIVTCYS